MCTGKRGETVLLSMKAVRCEACQEGFASLREAGHARPEAMQPDAGGFGHKDQIVLFSLEGRRGISQHPELWRSLPAVPKLSHYPRHTQVHHITASSPGSQCSQLLPGLTGLLGAGQHRSPSARGRQRDGLCTKSSVTACPWHCDSVPIAAPVSPSLHQCPRRCRLMPCGRALPAPLAPRSLQKKPGSGSSPLARAGVLAVQTRWARGVFARSVSRRAAAGFLCFFLTA